MCVVSYCSKKSKENFKIGGIKEKMVQELHVAFQKFHLCKKLDQQQLADLQFVNFQ